MLFITPPLFDVHASDSQQSLQVINLEMFVVRIEVVVDQLAMATKLVEQSSRVLVVVQDELVEPLFIGQAKVESEQQVVWVLHTGWT